MGRRVCSTQLGRAGTSAQASGAKMSPKPGRPSEALDSSKAPPASRTGKPSVMSKASPKTPAPSAKILMDKAENAVSVAVEQSARTGGKPAGCVGSVSEQQQVWLSTAGSDEVFCENVDVARINSSTVDRATEGKIGASRNAVPAEGRTLGAVDAGPGVQESRAFESTSLDDELGCSSGSLRHSFDGASKGRKTEETFQDRALRFHAEDWALLSETWGEEGKRVSKDDNKASGRKKGLHSPSASECSSSLFSTLDSTSSFSSRSEASSYFLRGDASPASIPLQGSRLPMSAISLPPSSVSECYPEALHKSASAGHAVEQVDLKAAALVQDRRTGVSSFVNELDDGSFLEFDFREGRMVQSPDDPLPGSEGDTRTFECAGIGSQELEVAAQRQGGPSVAVPNCKSQSLPSYRQLDEGSVEDDISASGFATPHSVFFSATTRSPESVFCSPEQRLLRGPSLGSDGDVSDYLNDNGDEWDLCRYDSDPSGAHGRGAGGNHRRASFSGASLLKEPPGGGKTAASVVPSNCDTSPKPLRAVRKTLPVKAIVTARPPSSPRVGETQEGGLFGRKIPQPRRSQWATNGNQSPAKGAASCPDSSWSDRPLLSGASDQSSTYSGQKENGNRSRRPSASPGAKRFPSPLCGSRTCPSPINRTYPSPMTRSAGAVVKMSGSPLVRTSTSPCVRTSSPARRNLYSSFKDSKLSHAIHDTFHPGLRGPKTEIPQQCARASMSPVRSWLDPVKESRASILASWASMYGVSSETALGKSPESGTDWDSEVSESHRSCSKMRISLRRKENRGGLATLYRSASPGMPRPRMPKSGLKSSGEVLKPLLPVVKTPSSTATTKLAKISGKSAHSLSQRVHSFVSRSAATATSCDKAGPVGGHMQCVYRDGVPSYSLVMDDTEEMFVAKVAKADPAAVSNDQVFTIYRWKGKARGKSGWRSWGKKDKPVCEYVGKLRVSSTLCDEASCTGEVKYYVESECVFVDVLDQEALSVPSILRSSQVCASVWDSTPGRSPWVHHYPGSPASSTYFSPAGSVGLDSPQGSMSDASFQNMFGKSSVSPHLLHKAKENLLDRYQRQLEKQMYKGSPGVARSDNRSRKSFQDVWSDSDGTDESDTRTSTCCQSHSELAAVVIRTPVEKDMAFLQGANLAPGEKSGWGLNFLRRRSVRPHRSSDVTSDEELCCAGSSRESDVGSDCGQGCVCGSDAPEADLLKSHSHSSSGSERGQRRKLCDLQKMEDNLMEHGKVSAGQLVVNVVLPAGKHAFSSTGVTGPQPLIQRWKSGGKCDCGNWDEGCGLTVLESKRPSHDQQFGSSQQKDQSCKIYTLGKKDAWAMDISQQGPDGLFSVRFQYPIDSLQAFATAVSVLRCREPFLPAAKRVDPKRKPPRFPLRPVSNGNQANSRLNDDTSVYGGYLVPDPPLSPCARS